MVERRLIAWLRSALALFGIAGILLLAGCGGGSGAPNNPYTPPPPYNSMYDPDYQGTVDGSFKSLFGLALFGKIPPEREIQHLRALYHGEATFNDAQLGRLLATIEDDQGPVMVTIEYQIDPARAEEFSAVMADSRRWRLRHGALHWGLYRDVADPGRYTEHFLVDSWLDRLRQIERLTAEDIALRDRKNEFHLGPEPPLMRHLLMEPTERR